MKNLITRFVRETNGQELIEYALLCALIGLATAASMSALKNSVITAFTNVATTVGS